MAPRQVALRLQLGVGLGDRVPGYVEAGGQDPGGGQFVARLQAPRKDGLPEPLVQLPVQGEELGFVQGYCQLHGAPIIQSGTIYSHRSGSCESPLPGLLSPPRPTMVVRMGSVIARQGRTTRWNRRPLP